MSGGVDEGDLLAVELNSRSTDVLSDGTGFTGGNVGVADSVLKRGLAVVNVSHEGHHRRAFTQERGIFFFHHIFDIIFRIGRAADFQSETVTGAKLFGIGFADGLIDGGKFSELDQIHNQFVGFLADSIGKVFDHQRNGQRNGFALDTVVTGILGFAFALGLDLLGHFNTGAAVLHLFSVIAGNLFGNGRGNSRFHGVKIVKIGVDQLDHIFGDLAAFAFGRINSLSVEFFDDLLGGDFVFD